MVLKIGHNHSGRGDMIIEENKQLHHLGLVAGMCDEIGIDVIIDEQIGPTKRDVSVGKAVKAMIINALGFTNRALYLTPTFMDSKPVELLVGPGISAEQLHEDCLGPALDALFEAGVTETFHNVASSALKQFNIDHRFVHLDTTSMSLHGVYNSEEEDVDPAVVKITKGLSKDNAPELNQVIVSLMTTYRSSFPLWFEALSGNTSDKTSFRETIKKFRSQFTGEQPYYVCDSALYSKKNIEELSESTWVTRVPETITEVKKAIRETSKENMIVVDNNIRYTPLVSQYGDIEQRWILVFSEKAYKREEATFTKNLVKNTDRNEKKLWHLCNQEFACEADAHKACKKFIQSLKYHHVDYSIKPEKHYKKKGRPGSDDIPAKLIWKIQGVLVRDETRISEAFRRKGMFMIATNELNTDNLSDLQLLEVYKAQGVSVERGFRFLKDPLFYSESLYLKKPERIMALTMVMSLSLMVYALAEKKIRDALKEQQLTIRDQKKRETGRPTIRWVFQVFEGILYLAMRDEQTGMLTKMTMNMSDQHRIILSCLGPPYERIYYVQ